MAPLWAGTEVAALEGLEAYLAVAAALWRLAEAQSSLSLIAGAPAVALQVQSIAFTSPLRVPSSRCHHVAGLCVLRLGLRECWYRQSPGALPSPVPGLPAQVLSLGQVKPRWLGFIFSCTSASPGGSLTWAMSLPWGRTGLDFLLAKTINMCDLLRQPGGPA